MLIFPRLISKRIDSFKSPIYNLMDVPDLFLNFSTEDVEQAVHSGSAMRLEVKSVDEEGGGEATSLVFKPNLAGYDAYFLAR
jgi:hypothetical protein